LDWPTGRSWDHLSRWGTEPLEKEESLPPDLVAALRAEPRLDAEGQRLFVSAYEGFASPPSAPDVLAVLTADRRLDEAGRALLVALFTSLVTSSNGHATDAVTVELVDPNRASRRAFSSPKHGRSHDDRQTDVRTAR